jgi:hypothetical protein
MDTVLMAVTALSLAMAIGMAMVLARLLREDRARSEARVAALVAMAAEPAPRPQWVASPPPRRAATSDSIAPPAGRQATGLRVKDAVLDLEIRPAAPGVAGVAELFAERNEPSPWRRRVAVIGALAAVGAALISGVVVARGPRGASAGLATAALRSGSPAAEVPPLELRSLHHTEEARSFVVAGVVHNPRGGAPLSGVVATAFAFGSDGVFLSSGRAPVDSTTLAPGDESPFVVTVPVTDRVSRYRIGFRAEDGRVIAHVDKRAPDALASKSVWP